MVRTSPFRRVTLLVTLLLLCLSVSPALAHGYIIRSIPEERSVVAHAPARVEYWFSEALEKQFSTLTVRDQTGKVIATGGVSDSNNSLITADLPRGLADGAYIVDMRLAFSSDGHVIAQSVVFFVGNSVAGVTGSAASTDANAFEVIWRALSLASTMLLFGAFALYTYILLPAWGNPTYRAGHLPPRVMRRLNAIVIGALIAAFLSNILALLQQTMVFFNADAAQVINQNLWQVVRIGTRFGDLWTGRMFLLGIVAAIIALSLFFREDQPENIRPTWTMAVWGMLLVVGTYSAGSHASGSLILPWYAMLNDWLHAIAVGFWAGSLSALVLVLPVALAPYEGEARRLALLSVLRRFSRIAVICVALVITTGIYSAVNWINQPADMTQTPYGNALLLKAVLVAGLLLIGLMHHMALRPERYRQWTARINALTHLHLGPATGMIGTLRLEVLFVLVVLASASLVSATPPPIPDFIRPSVPSPTATQTVGDFSVSMTLTPGGPGVNTYDTQITRNSQPVDGLSVRLQWVYPQRDQRSSWGVAEDADSGLYISTGAEIDRSGEWWTLLDIAGKDGKMTRAAFNWQISDAASVQESQPPGLKNIFAALGVLAVLGWIMAPYARRLYKQLDLSAASITVAVSAILATIFFIVIGFAYIESTQADYDAKLNPPPTIINTVLPDAGSLERGQQLYQSGCPQWQKTNLNSFIERLPASRDDQLFDATRGNWQGLPACSLTLSDAQRWDIVNYIRTFEKT